MPLDKQPGTAKWVTIPFALSAPTDDRRVLLPLVPIPRRSSLFFSTDDTSRSVKLCYGPAMTDNHFMPAAFQGKDLGCYRGGRLVFAGLNFEIKPGSALVLRGANGSGKTTLLRLMAGLGRLVSGKMLWDGKAIDDPEFHARRLRFVSHLDAIKPAQTAAENLTFWAKLWAPHTEGRTVATALEALDLTHLADFPARHLSAGQRHRLALARVLAAPAPLWLLDEPGNALDENSLSALSRMIADHRSQGGMVVVASHGAAFVEDGRSLDLGQFSAVDAGHWSDAL